MEYFLHEYNIIESTLITFSVCRSEKKIGTFKHSSQKIKMSNTQCSCQFVLLSDRKRRWGEMVGKLESFLRGTF